MVVQKRRTLSSSPQTSRRAVTVTVTWTVERHLRGAWGVSEYCGGAGGRV